MFSKIDVRRIVGDHVATLRDYRTNRLDLGDIAVLLLLPVAAAAGLTAIHGSLESTPITIATASLSVFAALLFNLLLLIYDAVKARTAGDDLRERFLKELFSNISFAILVAITAIVLLLGLSLVEQDRTLQDILSFLIYLTVTMFLVTLLMVLKRVHVLIAHEFE